MIDFHAHILPGVDDGAKDISETFKILKETKKYGFNQIISTAHYIEQSYETTDKERKEIISLIQKKLIKDNCNLNIHIGSEVYISNNIINLLKSKKASTIANTRYVLFELPLSQRITNIDEIIYELLENKYIPILAHPERYSFVQKNPEIISDLINKGILIQSNYGSILGMYGKEAKKTIKYLLKHNLVHFLGSDVHRSNSIYPKVTIAINKIEKIIGKEKLYMLTTKNAEDILNGLYVE